MNNGASKNKQLITLYSTLEPDANRRAGYDPQDVLDLRRMREILRAHGYNAAYGHIYDVWREYSAEEYSAGWLYLPKDDEEIMAVLLRYLVVKG